MIDYKSNISPYEQLRRGMRNFIILLFKLYDGNPSPASGGRKASRPDYASEVTANVDAIINNLEYGVDSKNVSQVTKGGWDDIPM